MLPDVVASVILTGLIPEIRSAVRFTAHGIQPGLHPTLLRGEIAVNPRSDDLFRTAIETRKSLGKRSDMSEETRAALGQFLKIFANATGYGIFAEMLRRELAIGEHQDVDVYADCSRFVSQTVAPETPGEYFFSPIAASITAAARCMLAILERLVTDAGGSYVLCDTDSMAIVASKAGGMVACPGGPQRLSDGREAVTVLSWEQTEIIRQRFAGLNPYDRSIVPGSVLQRVYDDASGKPLHVAAKGELRCVAISAKRYAIYDAYQGAPSRVDYG